MGVFKVECNNGESIENQGLSVLDQKNKPIAELPAGWSVVYTADQDPSTIAQFVQDGPNSLGGKVTTVGDDIGVVTFTGTVTRPDGSIMLDADGTVPQLEVTVKNSAPNSASFSAGTRVPE